MTHKLRLLFDECVGEPVVKSLATYLATRADPPEVKHVKEFQLHGEPDQKWLPKFAGQGWIVITADRGKTNRGAKMAAVCKELSITHVTLSGKIHNEMKSHEKTDLIIRYLDELTATVATDTPGSHYKLQKGSTGGFRLVKAS